MDTEHIELASIDDFVSTYSTGKEDVEAYNRTQELVKKGVPIRKIGDLIGRSYGTVIAWKNNKKRPRAISGLEKCLSLDLLPLDISNHKFPAINILAAKVFCTGHLSWASNGHQNMSIHGNLQKLEELQNYLQESLDLKTSIRPQRKGKDSFILSGGTDSALYARLLQAIGMPPSTADSNQMPEYVRKLVHSQSVDDSVVRRALQDFVHVLFEERFYVAHEKHTNRLYLKCFKKEEDARKYGNEVTDLIRVALPKLPITEDHVKVHATARESYLPMIYLKVADMASLSTYYPSLLNESSLS